MQGLAFYFLYGFLWLVTLLPFKALYILSDGIYILFYYIFRYRRSVVRENLKNSFPEKSENELLDIEKKFYHHLCDLIIEVSKLIHLSGKESVKRCRVTNLDLLEQYRAQGKHALVVFGHYGNWEWPVNAGLQFPGYQHLAIYKPLTNPYFDKFLVDLRQKFGLKAVAMHHIFRELIRLNQQGILTGTAFVADQAPTHSEANYWTLFLNQETGVFTGVERIAQKMKSVVLFGEVNKIKRGYYEIVLVPLSENPEQLEENEITRRHLAHLEKLIRRQPEYWLWSHRRWKLKPLQNQKTDQSPEE